MTRNRKWREQQLRSPGPLRPVHRGDVVSVVVRRDALAKVNASAGDLRAPRAGTHTPHTPIVGDQGYIATRVGVEEGACSMRIS